MQNENNGLKSLSDFASRGVGDTIEFFV